LSNSSLATPVPSIIPSPEATGSSLPLQTESNESSSEGGLITP